METNAASVAALMTAREILKPLPPKTIAATECWFGWRETTGNVPTLSGDPSGARRVLRRRDVHRRRDRRRRPVAHRGGDLLGQLRAHVADRADRCAGAGRTPSTRSA